MKIVPSLAALAPAVLAAAAPAAPVHTFGGLAISPSGDEVASIEGSAGGHGAIVVRSTADGRVLRTIDPCATCGYAGLSYGPDMLAFVARDRAAGVAQIEVARGQAVRTIAAVAGLAATPRFSPDGKRLAVLVTLGAAKEAGATQAGVRQIGEIGEKNDEQRIAVFTLGQPPVAAERVTPISPADRYIYEYDWTPDGLGFVVTSALGNGDNNWWVATLDHVDAATGAVRPIAKPAVQINFPRVSPDGRSVAFIGGLMSDFGSVGGDVWTAPLAGGAPANFTEGQHATFTSLAWTRSGLMATALRGDQAEVVAIDGAARAPRTLWGKPAGLAAGDGKVVFSADGRLMATVAQDYTHAAAIHAGPVASPRQLTHDNDAQPVSVVARSLSWKNEGFTVQGWLLSPLTASTTVKGPMITIVHGGPSSATNPAYVGPDSAQATYLRAGYSLFLPNPRGSYGQGEAFTAANKRDFGGGDLRDILAGIDAAERAAPIDDARLGLTGCSYGGFMAMWANTRTNRFKAIVAGAGLSDMISYYGTNGIDQWLLPFYGKTAYDDPKVYEDASAVFHVATARTPTFIYVGERDIEVPPTQSIEWWHALKAKGVDTSLVIYPDAGHCVPRPDQAADVRTRSIAWFDKYLAPKR